MSDLPKPSIPLLRDDTIDLNDLEGNLPTWIKYPGVGLGDEVFPVWRGCGQDSVAYDYAGEVIEVDDSNYDPEMGVAVAIRGSLLNALDQGWAMYSYSVAPLGGERGLESLRQFCYVGVRPRQAAVLPVAQMRDSHDLALDPDSVIGSTTAAVVPPYLAMRPRDKVTLSFAGYYDDGELDETWSQPKELSAADVGKPLTWQVPKSQLSWIEGGHAEVSYRVEYASGEQASDSAVQTFQIRPADSARLPAPQVEGHDDDSLDPGHFPDGLYLRIAPWPDMQDGDRLLVHWIGGREADSVIKSLRIDTSVIDSGVIEVPIEAHWLLANIGSQVRVFHQYAREGVAHSSEDLTLDIRAPLNLLPPNVEHATAEGGAGENKGLLLAFDARTGAYVDVPDSFPLGPGDRLAVHWDGHPAGGQHIADTPVDGRERRFRIPSTAIAANMGPGETKRFEVFYQLTPEGEEPLKSVPFNLRIEPIARSLYGNVQIAQADSGALSLARVPAAGADLVLARWYFMAVGQLLSIEASGVDAGGQPVNLMVRNAAPVTAAEVAAEQIEARLVRMFLESLQMGQNFTLTARVSFDGGGSYYPFKDLNLPLRP